ncbi:MAG: HupE/UreJ family protein, partial [Pseudogulbenkiania sp.]|nr:HupE/UreJ family protein [Pseudogulbenkiania sp.]
MNTSQLVLPCPFQREAAMRATSTMLIIVSWLVGACALAHPLGNSTVNRWAQLAVSAQAVDVEYVLDLAELPTLVESAIADRDGNGEVSAQEWDAYTRRWAQGLQEQLQIQINGNAMPLQLRSQRWQRRDGDAGLYILRLEARFRARLGVTATQQPASLHYRDVSQASTLGWKEVVLRTANDVSLERTTLERHDRSKRLSAFPAEAGNAYPDVTSGSALFTLKPVAQGLPPAKTASAEAQAIKETAPVAPPTQKAATTNEAVHTGVSAIASTVEAAHAPVPTKTNTSYLWRYFRLGMHHIARGWDHLLFLFGLLLLRLELCRVALVITAFTVAHSLTLGLAAAGWITPPLVWIEPTIALTIAYVGLLNLRKRDERHGIALAFTFGLIHGFGFAGALAESAAAHALHGATFLLSLASFNLGIE